MIFEQYICDLHCRGATQMTHLLATSIRFSWIPHVTNLLWSEGFLNFVENSCNLCDDSMQWMQLRSRGRQPWSPERVRIKFCIHCFGWSTVFYHLIVAHKLNCCRLHTKDLDEPGRAIQTFCCYKICNMWMFSGRQRFLVLFLQAPLWNLLDLVNTWKCMAMASKTHQMDIYLFKLLLHKWTLLSLLRFRPRWFSPLGTGSVSQCQLCNCVWVCLKMKQKNKFHLIIIVCIYIYYIYIYYIYI